MSSTIRWSDRAPCSGAAVCLHISAGRWVGFAPLWGEHGGVTPFGVCAGVAFVVRCFANDLFFGGTFHTGPQAFDKIASANVWARPRTGRWVLGPEDAALYGEMLRPSVLAVPALAGSCPYFPSSGRRGGRLNPPGRSTRFGGPCRADWWILHFRNLKNAGSPPGSLKLQNCPDEN